MAYGQYKKRKITKTRQQSERATTVQHDVTTQYVRKNMPKKKKKAWVKFVKKVNAVDDGLVGLKTVILNDEINPTLAAGSAGQSFGVIHLYGRCGTNTTSENGAADLYEIFSKDPEMKQSAAPYFPIIGKVKFRSAVIDFTMTNLGTRTMEVDVYKIVYRANEKPYASFFAAHQDYNLTSASVDGTSNIINLNTRGATPFGVGGLMSLLKSKVVWKKKFLISIGQSAVFQHRDARNKWISVKDMQNLDQDFTYKGLTVTYLFVYKCPEVDEFDTQKLRVGATRSYTYKIDLNEVAERKSLVI